MSFLAYIPVKLRVWTGMSEYDIHICMFVGLAAGRHLSVQILPVRVVLFLVVKILSLGIGVSTFNL